MSNRIPLDINGVQSGYKVIESDFTSYKYVSPNYIRQIRTFSNTIINTFFFGALRLDTKETIAVFRLNPPKPKKNE